MVIWSGRKDSKKACKSLIFIYATAAIFNTDPVFWPGMQLLPLFNRIMGTGTSNAAYIILLSFSSLTCKKLSTGFCYKFNIKFKKVINRKSTAFSGFLSSCFCLWLIFLVGTVGTTQKTHVSYCFIKEILFPLSPVFVGTLWEQTHFRGNRFAKFAVKWSFLLNFYAK